MDGYEEERDHIPAVGVVASVRLPFHPEITRSRDASNTSIDAPFALAASRRIRTRFGKSPGLLRSWTIGPCPLAFASCNKGLYVGVAAENSCPES